MKTIGIRDLLSEGVNAPFGIWALNSSGNSELGQIGEVLLQIPKLNGSKSDPLKVDQTWLAQDLTRQIPRAQLLESSEFRHAVESNLITLVPENVALKINGREGAGEERQRLTATRQQVRKIQAARTISNSKAEITRADGVVDEDDPVEVTGNNVNHDNVAELAAGGLDLTDDGFTHQFVMFVNKTKREKDMTALNAIRARGKLTSKELRFLRANLTNHPKTKTAITSQLIARKQARDAKKARLAA